MEKEDLKAARLKATQAALKDVEAGRLIDGEQVMEWLSRWGEADEGNTRS